MASSLDPASLALVPVQAVPFETGEDGRVTLLRPKFVDPRWSWLQRFMKRPTFRVRLDDKGSFIWLAMDGARTVGELAGLARDRFGEAGEPHEERCGFFVQQLVKGGFVVNP
jgi:Coenzyme PQQ synthesis protein D (PqqD)